jgi:hypothetical protein
MGKHLAVVPRSHHFGEVASQAPRAKRQRLHFSPSTPALYTTVFTVVVAFIMVYVIDPSSGAVASPMYALNEASRLLDTQSLTADHKALTVNKRDGLDTVVSLAPAAGIPDPGSAQAIAYILVAKRGWSGKEFDCLVSLWDRESHWNPNSHNSSSGAHGIPQALPGNKMASAGADWWSNPKTQIIWGLGYIANRYGTPCGAWAHSEEHNWY